MICEPQLLDQKHGIQNHTYAALAQLMGSEKYSDLKLVCEGHEFRVHKAIVCLNLPFLLQPVIVPFRYKPCQSYWKLGLKRHLLVHRRRGPILLISRSSMLNR